ncbi:FYVE-type domain-containing protein [Entamoeba marina]
MSSGVVDITSLVCRHRKVGFKERFQEINSVIRYIKENKKALIQTKSLSECGIGRSNCEACGKEIFKYFSYNCQFCGNEVYCVDCIKSIHLSLTTINNIPFDYDIYACSNCYLLYNDYCQCSDVLNERITSENHLFFRCYNFYVSLCSEYETTKHSLDGLRSEYEESCISSSPIISPKFIHQIHSTMETLTRICTDFATLTSFLKKIKTQTFSNREQMFFSNIKEIVSIKLVDIQSTENEIYLLNERIRPLILPTPKENITPFMLNSVQSTTVNNDYKVNPILAKPYEQITITSQKINKFTRVFQYKKELQPIKRQNGVFVLKLSNWFGWITLRIKTEQLEIELKNCIYVELNQE